MSAIQMVIYIYPRSSSNFDLQYHFRGMAWLPFQKAGGTYRVVNKVDLDTVSYGLIRHLLDRGVRGLKPGAISFG